MLEYVFFHEAPFVRFVEFLQARSIETHTRSTNETFEVAVSEDLDDMLVEAIESQYEGLMDVDRDLFESGQETGADNYQAAGVVLNLKDGQAFYADVDSELLARIMSVMSAEEFGRVVTAIVGAVENPDARTFCQRMRDGDAAPD